MTITQQKPQGPPERLPRSPVVGLSKPRLLQIVGPGLSSGAAGDDLAVITAYSQAGLDSGEGPAGSCRGLYKKRDSNGEWR
jgi:hypothetical protein